MLRHSVAAVLIGIIGSSTALPAWAEGGSPDSGETHAPKPKKSKKKAPKKAATSVAKTPDAPMPYTSSTTAPIDQHDLPPPVPHAVAPTVMELPSREMETPPPPPPPPPAEPERMASPPQQSSTLILECDSKVYDGGRLISTGRYNIELERISSPEQFSVSYRVFGLDPAHQSLWRETACWQIICTAQVSQGAYYMAAERDKKRTFSLSLDRATGILLGELETRALIGLSNSRRTERGQCRRIEDRAPLF